MKKEILIGLLALAITFNPKTSSAQGAFHAGDNILAVGVGFGSSYGGFGAGSESPAISVQFEHGNWAVGGPGVISLGGYLGYKSYSYDDLTYYSQSVSYVVIGLRSAYHFNMIESADWDLYAGVMLHYDIASYTYTSHDPFYDHYIVAGADSRLRLDLYIGARYFVSPRVALFAELGYGISNFTLGAAFKL
jgi:hypothetical protein